MWGHVFHSIQSLYIQILPVSALAVLPDFHRIDGFSELMCFEITEKFSPPKHQDLSRLIFFLSLFLSSYFLDVLFCKVLIEFFFGPDAWSVQVVFASPIVQPDYRGKSTFLSDNGCPKKYTQLLPVAHQDGANVGRAAAKKWPDWRRKRGSQLCTVEREVWKYIILKIQNIYFLRGSEFQYQKMANAEGRQFFFLLDICSSK